MAKKTDYQGKDAGELVKELGEKRAELRTLRFAGAGSRTKDSNAAAKARKDIARILTALTAKRNA